MKIAENNENYNKALDIQKQIYKLKFNIKGDVNCNEHYIRDTNAYGGWDGWYGNKSHGKRFYGYGDE